MNTAVINVARSGLSRQLAQTGRALVQGFRCHALLHVLALSALLISLAAAFQVGRLVDTRMIVLYSFPFLVVIGALCAVTREIYRLWRSGYEGSAIKAVGRMIASDLLAPERIANFLHASVALSLFMSAFTSLKILLPSLNPFQWDETFIEWDRLVHFGIHPYLILQPLLGHPYVTTALDFAYNSWFIAMFGAWVWLGAARRDSAIRQHFLIAFMITWFLGTSILGTLFSSVGPAFYGRLQSGDDPFMPLLNYLEEASNVSPLWVLNNQDLLWNGYVTGEGLIKGISAMPSMHVGTCILFILLGFGSGRNWLGWLAVSFTTVIFLGSVHLAWHYAIDGYAGAAVALIGWHVAGRLVRWDRARQGLADA